MCNEHAQERLEEAVRLERGGLLEKALAELSEVARSDDPALLAEAMRHQADIHRARCEWETAIALARRSREVARAAGLRELEAEAVNAEGAVHLSRGAFGDATALFAEMLGLCTEPRIRGIALQNLGISAAEQGQLEEARRRFLASHDCFEAAGYTRGMATALVNSGRIALLEDDAVAAEELCSKGDVLARRVGDLELSALASFNLAEARLRTGHPEVAEGPAAVAMGYFTGIGNDWRRIECLRLLGDVHREQNEAEVAIQCYRRALDLARERETPEGEVAGLEERLRLLEERVGAAPEDAAEAARSQSAPHSPRHPSAAPRERGGGARPSG